MALKLQARVFVFGKPALHLAVMLHFNDGQHYYASWGPENHALIADAGLYGLPAEEILLPMIDIDPQYAANAQDFITRFVAENDKAYQQLFFHYVDNPAQVVGLTKPIQRAFGFDPDNIMVDNDQFARLSNNCAQRVWEILCRIGYQKKLADANISTKTRAVLPSTFANKLRQISVPVNSEVCAHERIMTPALLLDALIEDLSIQAYSLRERNENAAYNRLDTLFHEIYNIKTEIDTLASKHGFNFPIAAAQQPLSSSPEGEMAELRKRITNLQKEIRTELQSGILAKHRNTLKPILATIVIALLALIGNIIYLHPTPRKMLVNGWRAATKTYSARLLTKTDATFEQMHQTNKPVAGIKT